MIDGGRRTAAPMITSFYCFRLVTMSFLTVRIFVVSAALSVAMSTLLAANAGSAPERGTAGTPALDQLKAAIEQIRRETNQPAVGIALVDKNGPYWVAGLGEADIERHGSADENSLFRLASASKMLTGLAVMKLVEEGRLHLDDRLSDRAPGLAFSNPWERTHPILIAHLLEHTTGWDTRLSEYVHEAPDSMSLREGLADPARIKARTSRWMPGTRHAYSNSGPVVAAYVVEQVTRMRFEDYVQEALLNPLGMQSTSYFKSALWNQRGVTAYVNGKPEKYAHLYSRPASSANSTPADMARLLQLFINRGIVDGHVIMKPDAIRQMETPQTTLGASHGIASGYGLTLEVIGYKQNRIAFYGHSGNIPGHIVEFRYSPELQSGFVFMLNAQNGAAHDRILDALRDYLIRDRRPPAVTPSRLPRSFRSLDGLYRSASPRGDVLRIASDIAGVVRLSSTGTSVQQEPFFGGRVRTYLSRSEHEQVLHSTWTGLPSLARVNDPLMGSSVQIEGELYQRISEADLYSRILLLGGVVVLAISSLVFALVWVPRRLLGRLPEGVAIQVRVWPLLTSFALLATPVVASLLPNDPSAISENPVTLTLYMLSLTYPVLATASLLTLFGKRTDSASRWAYLHSAAVTAAHVLFAIYLTNYGLIGFRIWD